MFATTHVNNDVYEDVYNVVYDGVYNVVYDGVCNDSSVVYSIV
jgi:hypothetical protein